MEEGDISPAQQTTFHKSVRAFYVCALEYAIQNLPQNDDLLKNAKFVNFGRRECANISEVEYSTGKEGYEIRCNRIFQLSLCILSVHF